MFSLYGYTRDRVQKVVSRLQLEEVLLLLEVILLPLGHATELVDTYPKHLLKVLLGEISLQGWSEGVSGKELKS